MLKENINFSNVQQPVDAPAVPKMAVQNAPTHERSPTTVKAEVTPTTVEAEVTPSPSFRDLCTAQYAFFAEKLAAVQMLDQVETLTGKPRGAHIHVEQHNLYDSISHTAVSLSQLNPLPFSSFPAQVVGTGLGAVTAVLAVSGALGYLVNDLFAFWYPTAMIVSALTAATTADDCKPATNAVVYWAKYFVIYASLSSVVDPIFRTVLGFVLGLTFPYDIAKMALLMWCMAHPGDEGGAAVLFHKLYAPAVRKCIIACTAAKARAMVKLTPLLAQFGSAVAAKSD